MSFFRLRFDICNEIFQAYSHISVKLSAAAGAMQYIVIFIWVKKLINNKKVKSDIFLCAIDYKLGLHLLSDGLYWLAEDVNLVWG